MLTKFIAFLNIGIGPCLIFFAFPLQSIWADNPSAPSRPSPPQITNVMRAYGTVEEPFNFTVTATHMTVGDKAVKFTADGLPPGFVLKNTPANGGSSASAQITGTLHGKPLTSPIMLTAINAAGKGTAPLTVIIGAVTPGMKFFTTYKDKNGVWWLKDPKGHLVISKAMDNFGLGFYRPLPGWANFFDFVNALSTFGSAVNAETALEQLITSLNFNTIGAWSSLSEGPVPGTSRELWATPMLQVGSSFPGKPDDAKITNFPDVYDPGFKPFAEGYAEKICAPLRSEPWVIGYYIDNEIYWGYAWDPANKGENTQFVAGTQLLLRYMGGKSRSDGHFAALKFLQSEYHKDIQKLDAAWNTNFASWDDVGGSDFRCKDATPPPALYNDCNVFAGMVAQKYFSIINAALKKADPNHLNLGCRYASGAPGYSGSYPLPAVVAQEAKYVDVISLNCYGTDPSVDIQWYVTHEPANHQKPVIIGEFSFRSKQNNSNEGNGGSSGPVVDTQAERAADYATYIKIGMAQPCLIGYSWFGATDEPTGAEGNNYGVWDLAGKPYPELTKQMKESNAQAETLHAAARGN